MPTHRLSIDIMIYVCNTECLKTAVFDVNVSLCVEIVPFLVLVCFDATSTAERMIDFCVSEFVDAFNSACQCRLCLVS